MSLPIRVVTVSAMALGALAACHSDSTSVTAPTLTAASIAIQSGDGARLTAGGATDSVTVIVLSATGTPIAGAAVSWQVASGDGTVSTATSTTDANGLASTTLIAGTHAGPIALSVSTDNVTAVSVGASVVAAAPAKLVAMSATTDSLAEGATWAFQAVQVQDSFGNPVAGVTVLATEQNAGDGDALVTPTLVSDANGVVSAIFSAGDVSGDRVLDFQTSDGALALNYTVDVEDSGAAALRAAAR